MLVRVGEARRDCRQREGKGERLGLPRLIRVRSERRGPDIRYSEPAGFERSGAGVSEHRRYEETQDGLRWRTRSDDPKSGVGHTPVMMTKVVSVPVCPRSCRNAGVIFERVASVFIFMFCVLRKVCCLCVCATNVNVSHSSACAADNIPCFYIINSSQATI